MRFLLVRFSFVRISKTIPKYLVDADSPLLDSENPSFVRKLVTMCITALSCVFLVGAEDF